MTNGSKKTLVGNSTKGVGGQSSLDNNKYAFKGRGVSTQMIMYYVNISAQLIFKVFKKNSSYRELHVS